MPRERLSADEARRLALGAQGFAEPRRADGRALSRVLARTGLLQIDSVNVLQRAHYLPVFSRIGPYDTAALDRLSHYAPRRLFEYWGHEASLLPVALWPLLQWRMARADRDAWGGMSRIAREQPALVERLLETVRDRGPGHGVVAGRGRSARQARDVGLVGRQARPRVAVLERPDHLGAAPDELRARSTTCPSGCSRAAIHAAPVPPADEAQRELLRRSARALGVATETDLRDYFRLPTEDTRLRLAELVEAGDLLPVTVAGWRRPAYLDPGARIPRHVDARALLAPFDPLIWERARTERIFGFRYRIEIYVPAPKRVHGYYVLPFLLGDRLVARVDLKADRKAGVLRVQASHLEPGAPPETAAELGAELERMAAWLGLERVLRARPRGA